MQLKNFLPQAHIPDRLSDMRAIGRKRRKKKQAKAKNAQAMQPL